MLKELTQKYIESFNNKDLENNKSNFEEFITTKFKEKTNLHTIINFNSNFLFLSKNEILRSDKTGEIEGYLVTIKLLNTGLLNDNTIFEEIEIKNEKTTSTDLKLNFELLKNINIKIETTSSNILNRIEFFDHNNEYIISINTSNKRELVKNSKETIYIFNFRLN